MDKSLKIILVSTIFIAMMAYAISVSNILPGCKTGDFEQATFVEGETASLLGIPIKVTNLRPLTGGVGHGADIHFKPGESDGLIQQVFNWPNQERGEYYHLMDFYSSTLEIVDHQEDQITLKLYCGEENYFQTRPLRCIDSDGGIDYEIKGILSTNDNPYGRNRPVEPEYDFSDSCSQVPGFEGKLVEYYCDGEEKKTRLYDCPNGCLDGACV